MNMKTCPKGHFYDGDTNATCPVCAAEQGRTAGMMDDYGATEPVGGGSSGGFSGVGETEPVGGGFSGGFSNVGATEPVGGGFSGGFSGVGATEPMTGTKAPTRGFNGSGETMHLFDDKIPGVDNYNDETMAVNPGMVAGFTPVVGWLVCTEGPDRGHDYRIRTGYNHIGRAEHMDICIRGDKHRLRRYGEGIFLRPLGRQKHCPCERENGHGAHGASRLRYSDGGQLQADFCAIVRGAVRLEQLINT